MLTIISTLGCIQISDNSQNIIEPSNNPQYPDIFVINRSSPQIVWESGFGNGIGKRSISYFNLNNISNEKNNKKIISYDGHFPKINGLPNNDLHIIFLQQVYSKEKYTYSFKIFDTKMDSNENIIYKNKEINKSIEITWSSNNRNIIDFCIDFQEKIHILYSSTKGISHIILDNYGNIIKEYILTKYMTGELTTNNNIRKQIVTNNINNKSIFHILWDNEKDPYDSDLEYSEIYYLKQNPNGSIILNNTLITSKIKFIRSQSIVFDSNDKGYIFWSEYSKTPDIYDPENTCFAKLNPNGTISFQKKINKLHIIDVKIDNNNNLNIIGTIGAQGEFPNNDKGIYLKLNTDGNEIISPIKFTEKLAHHSANLGIDEDNNVHIVWHGIETKWKEYPITTASEPVDFYTIYYSKIDSNGNIEIDHLVIDSDEEIYKENNENISTNLPLCGLLIAIPVIIIIIIFFFIRLKLNKMNDNKTKIE